MGAVVEVDRDRARRRPESADYDAAAPGVCPEDLVWVRVLAADERVELGAGDGRHVSSSSRRMPATGIATQSGRLSSSYWSS